MSNGQLKSGVERIERLHEERASIADDIRDVYAEMKSAGYDPKIIRAVIAYRKQDASVRDEHDALVATYLNEIGA
jgi:uncharacterized protein (UPF0335 family)